MENALIAVAVLACPIGMGLMMWFMGKGMMGGRKEKEGSDEVQRLRSEQAAGNRGRASGDRAGR